mgnify:CR=1 FL=1
MTEDELGNHDLVLGMHGDGNALAVIVNSELGGRDGDIDLGHAFGLVLDCRLPSYVIERVHDELVEDLEQAWIELDLSPGHSLSIIDPAPLLMRVPRSDIGVWELENVLALGQFLVGGHRTQGWGMGW